MTQLLASSFAALAPGGLLLDHDAHVAADKRGPLPVAEHSVLLMHSTPGKCWSVGELTAMARRVGFVQGGGVMFGAAVAGAAAAVRRSRSASRSRTRPLL